MVYVDLARATSRRSGLSADLRRSDEVLIMDTRSKLSKKINDDLPPLRLRKKTEVCKIVGGRVAPPSESRIGPNT